MRALFTFSVLFVFVMLAGQNAQAQCTSWGKKRPHWQLRSGIGLLSTFSKDGPENEIPPLSLELRYYPTPVFSIGLLAGGSVNNATIEHHSGPGLTLRNQFQMLAVRTALHTQRWERWAPYGGISLAYQYNKITALNAEGDQSAAIHYSPRKSGFFYGAFVGTCYQPRPQLEIFGELGYGLSILTLGAGFSW